MTVSLVAYVPYQLIVGSIKNIVKSNGKFHHAQACTEMTTMHAYTVYDELA
jgi:hypothetical protein